MCIRNAVEQVCYLVPSSPSWAPTIVTCKAEDQTVTAPSAPVMPLSPNFRTLIPTKMLAVALRAYSPTRAVLGVGFLFPPVGFPGDWLHQAMNDKLRLRRSAGW